MVMGNTSHGALSAHYVLSAGQHSLSHKTIGLLIHFVQQVQELGISLSTPNSLFPNVISEK